MTGEAWCIAICVVAYCGAVYVVGLFLETRAARAKADRRRLRIDGMAFEELAAEVRSRAISHGFKLAFPNAKLFTAEGIESPASLSESMMDLFRLGVASDQQNGRPITGPASWQGNYYDAFGELRHRVEASPAQRSSPEGASSDGDI